MSTDCRMSPEAFAEAGLALSRAANVVSGLHSYFVQHRSRLYDSCRLFQLFESRLGDVLEIGPFYGYTPFMLRPNATSYTVLEGDDPATYPLKPLYQQHDIAVQFVDLFEMFGPTHSASHVLPFAEASFDTVLCWGTMEHFNFNPVKFVRELQRVLRRGGKACIDVPNKASFQNLYSLLFGRFEEHLIDSYYEFEDYTSNGKKAFYGFHWREYSGPELVRLFARAGFTIRQHGTFVSFQNWGRLSAGRRAARVLTRWMSALLPRFASDVFVVAEK